MTKRAAGREKKQEATSLTMTVGMQQLMLPLLLAMDATKKGLLDRAVVDADVARFVAP